VQLTFDWEAHEFVHRLGQIEHNMHHLEPGFRGVHRSFIGVESYQFSSQGGLSGGWAPLSAERLQVKARHGLDPRILHATHRLRESLTRSGSSEHIFHIEGDTLTMGTRVPYARAHDDAKRAGMPRRRVLVVNREHTRRWAAIMGRWIFGGQVER
jgi:hypothetical protein